MGAASTTRIPLLGRRVRHGRIRLRRASASDVPVLVRILSSDPTALRAAGIRAALVDGGVLDALVRSALVRDGERTLSVVGRATGQVIGVAILRVPNPADEVPWISLLAIAPPYRGLGLGTEAAHLLERLIARGGWAQVRLGVLADERQALRFWLRLGYAEVPGSWRAYNGSPRGIVTLAKSLAAPAPVALVAGRCQRDAAAVPVELASRPHAGSSVCSLGVGRHPRHPVHLGPSRP